MFFVVLFSTVLVVEAVLLRSSRAAVATPLLRLAFRPRAAFRHASNTPFRAAWVAGQRRLAQGGDLPPPPPVGAEGVPDWVGWLERVHGGGVNPALEQVHGGTANSASPGAVSEVTGERETPGVGIVRKEATTATAVADPTPVDTKGGNTKLGAEIPSAEEPE